jgi:hypothetical protein
LGGTVASGAFLVLYIILGILIHVETEMKIEEFESTEKTIERARKNGTDVESAALQLKVVETNQWLANVNYWKDTDFGFWLPDKIDKLEPIE